MIRALRQHFARRRLARMVEQRRLIRELAALEDEQ